MFTVQERQITSKRNIQKEQEKQEKEKEKRKKRKQKVKKRKRRTKKEKRPQRGALPRRLEKLFFQETSRENVKQLRPKKRFLSLREKEKEKEKKTSKTVKEKEKKKEKEKVVSKGYVPRRFQTIFFF